MNKKLYQSLIAVGVLIVLLLVGYGVTKQTQKYINKQIDTRVEQVSEQKVNEKVVSYFEAHKAELKGEKGDKGDSGKNGANGANGKAGANGANGKAGANGKNGNDGCTWLGFSSYWPYRDLGWVCP
jgi:hypothetical protein